MDSLFLFQFACFIFMLINAFIIALSHLHVRWGNKRYECSRWMIFTAMTGLAIQYLIQMSFGFRAADDSLGAVINILIYTPCISLISISICNIEAIRDNLKNMIMVCSGIYAAIIVVFCLGTSIHHSLYIREGLYLMLGLFCISVFYCIYMIMQEMNRRKNILETMAATDMLPYVRHSHASITILWLAILVMPVAIFSTTLLYIVGPVVLLALLFFNLTFVALGNNYIPTEELLDKEEENQRDCRKSPARQLSEERIRFIRNSLDQWCADSGYKDSTVNMLTLSRNLCITKDELSVFFEQCMKSTFRIWLSDIRFNAAKKMMMEYPDYSNDIISAECGFSARTYLYRIFKSKEGCTPTEWRDEQTANAARNNKEKQD